VANPNVQVVERSMDSIRQLDALLSDWLDIAILRVTRQMVAEIQPAGSTVCSGWNPCCW
jgi:hypothetical protein